jgi:hypothetical protein
MNKHAYLRNQALLLAGLLLSLGATAQPIDVQQRYQQELAACKSAQATQSRASCQREAGAALAAAKHGDLDDGPAAYERNAYERCMALPAPERYECMARMRTPAAGSVGAGGLLREAVTPVAPVK